MVDLIGLARKFTPGPISIMRWIADTAGLFMIPITGTAGTGQTPAAALMEGDFDAFYHRAAMNYTGVDTWGNLSNDFGSMLKRASGAKVAILGNLLALVFGEMLKAS